ncbi:hypothetical protein LOH54_03790 [Sulfurimonas sp. HSL-3221]|uniref:hypothetical protein n=1 Tax=Sulfurimonadaceae TaxID=2771471 RepID=UPI001E489731|nr:hypothetical protein [Sulfurimonas sp. HSL-3221]UFS63255.1 hypothetical protein LOH54_03790 [Sulfurimonas sp. HSL-3221]
MKKLALILGLTVSLLAADKCAVYAVKYQEIPQIKVVTINGSSTCETGTVVIKIYDGKGQFLQQISAPIENSAFSTQFEGTTANGLRFKHSVLDKDGNVLDRY